MSNFRENNQSYRTRIQTELIEFRDETLFLLASGDKAEIKAGIDQARRKLEKINLYLSEIEELNNGV